MCKGQAFTALAPRTPWSIKIKITIRHFKFGGHECCKASTNHALNLSGGK